jgi:hypothetical protein
MPVDPRTPQMPLPAGYRRFSRICLAMAVLLLMQFVVGMVVNLYVAIPASHPGANAPDFFPGIGTAIAWAISRGALALAAHVVLGLALIVVSVSHIITAVSIGRRSWVVLSIAGTLFLVGAAFNGASFVNYGHDFSSLIMSGCFAVALLCYAACGIGAAVAAERSVGQLRGD